MSIKIHDLKHRTTRGAFASIAGQSTNVALRLGSMMILARMLTPRDFGLIGMSGTCIELLALLQDAGLVAAAVQSPTLSHEQSSTLFWLNLGLGTLLTLICAGLAPILALFYHEPQVTWITVLAATTFIFNGAAAQHRALLSRAMRLSLLAGIDSGATFGSVALGITLAASGFGYWSLAAMSLAPSLITCVALMITGTWIPGPPRLNAGIGSMLKYGGVLMADSVLMYIGYNTDKVLLGRFWGAPALGLYGRAYTLANIPQLALSNAVNAVTFPALSRLQDQENRFRRAFSQSYTLFLSLILPITIACGLFGEDIIRVFLGQKWMETAPTFRALAPTILAFALINPTGVLLNSLGKVVQSFLIGCAIVPVVIIGYWSGLSHGPVGVALGFSAAMLVMSVPAILWGIKGTPITRTDIWNAASPPLTSALIAAVCACACWEPASHIPFAPVRLSVLCGVLFSVHGALLYFVLDQKTLYKSVLERLNPAPAD